MLVWIGISISVTPLRSNSEAKLVYTNLALNRVTEVTLSVLFPVVGSSTSPILFSSDQCGPITCENGTKFLLLLFFRKKRTCDAVIEPIKIKRLKKDHEPNKHRERIHNNQIKHNLLHLAPGYHMLYLSDTSQDFEQKSVQSKTFYHSCLKPSRNMHG